jgi:hypothetical protein
MMGRKYREQANFFYEFRLDDMIPKGHLLRPINVFVTSVLGDLHEQLGPFYSAIGRPSIDPELLIRMLIVGLYSLNRRPTSQTSAFFFRDLAIDEIADIVATLFLFLENSIVGSFNLDVVVRRGRDLLLAGIGFLKRN